ncbi:MAG: hypothetical protein ACREQ5_05545 [Candidatus Dormibacteria bacterium]
MLLILIAQVATLTASADTPASGVPPAEAACVQDAGNPNVHPSTMYAHCAAAVEFFRGMTKSASASDRDLIATNIALFEFYQAHAADQIPGNAYGDTLRGEAHKTWTSLSLHSSDPATRNHAKLTLACFFGGDANACKRAFSASPNGF